MQTIKSGEHVFEIVDRVPCGYTIWNIGKNMVDGYLPLCRLKAVQPFQGGREIEVDTLKAIKVDGAQIILEAVGGGQNTPEQMEAYIKRYRNTKPGTWSYKQVRSMKAALPIMRKFAWN